MPREVGDQPARELARRPRLDVRAQVLERHQQCDAGCDLEVGRVRVGAADDAVGDVGVDPVEEPGDRGEVGDRMGVVSLVEAGRQLGDRRCGLGGDRHREPELRAGQVALDRAAVLAEQVPDEPPRDVLENLVPPGLRLLDLGPGIGVGGEERRVGRDPVELASDLPAALDPAAVDPQRRHRHSGESSGAEDRLREHRDEVDPRVGDALALEHQPRRPAGMGSGDREQASLHGGEPTRIRPAAVATIARCS